MCFLYQLIILNSFCHLKVNLLFSCFIISIVEELILCVSLLGIAIFAATIVGRLKAELLFFCLQGRLFYRFIEDKGT